MLGAKSVMLSDTLHYLPTEKIEPFFTYVRTKEESFPSDAKLVKLLNSYLGATNFTAPPKYDESELATPDQHRKAIRTIMAVCDGKIDQAEGKVWLEKIFANEV